MNTLDQWAAAIRADLGLDPATGGQTEMRTVLDLARDVVHGVERPAAPLTAYLVGVAVGSGLPLAEAARRVQARAEGWTGAADEP